MNDIPLFILHWNRVDDCLVTIERFRNQAAPIEISVIDNGSKPELRSALERALPGDVHYRPLGKNFGWGGAFNHVLKDWLAKDSSKLCFISAHDSLPEPECINRLIDAFMSNDHLGIVSPEYGINHLPIFSPIRGPRLVHIAPRPRGTIECTDFVHGTLMGFRRECLQEIGLFDDRYFAYGDETEISLRANRAGWKTAIVWGAVVGNPGSSTPGGLATYLLTRGSLLMAKDYGGFISGLCRAALVVINTIKLVTLGQMLNWRQTAPARVYAVGDFLTGYLGKPGRYLKT